MHSQRNFVLSGEGFVHRMALSVQDRVLCVLPLFHINALFYSFAGALCAGSTVVFERRFSASRFWKTVKESGATQVNLIAAAGNILMKRDRGEFEPGHSLDRVYLSPLTPALYEGFRTEFGVSQLREGYGLTEAPGVLNQPMDVPPVLGTMGRVSVHPSDERPLAELQLRDPFCELAKDGEAGELWVRSPLLMQGYFNDQAATDAVVKDGWFRTGDLVRQDLDKNIVFVERLKDIIRRRGENISGVELDAVISTNPNIALVAVVATPSEMGEDEILAAIVPTSGFSPAGFKEWCVDALPPHKRPRFIAICKDLPRTPSEKIEKYKIKQDKQLRGVAIDLTDI
jgi:crotonobetaine/carnitine-CoA ligase